MILSLFRKFEQVGAKAMTIVAFFANGSFKIRIIAKKSISLVQALRLKLKRFKVEPWTSENIL